MPVHEDRPERVKEYPAEQVRGGEIILRTRAQRVIFIAGLAAAVLLGLALVLANFLSR
ncbi:MAG: hypothetical protein AB7O43_10835 [Hyphomicrobiaceae bacterium]